MNAQILHNELLDLEARGLVRVQRDDPTHVSYRFKHALVQEATYNSILTTRRAQLHRDVAEGIRDLFPGRDALLALTAAEHWFKAHELNEMLGEVLPRSQELIFGGHGAALLQLVDHLSEKELADPAQLNELGRIFYHLSSFGRALEFNRACLAIAERLGDILLQAKAASGIGLALWNMSDFGNAESWLVKSRDLCARAGDEATLANAEFNLSNVMRDRGDYEGAIAAADRALELFIKLDSKTFAAYTQLMLGTCHYSAGDYALAASYYSLALAAIREAGDPRGIAVGLCDQAELEETVGSYEDARIHFEQAIEKAEYIMNDYLLSFAKAGLARVQMLQGNLEQAHENALAALETAVRVGSKEREGAAHRVLAEIFTARRQAKNAVQEAKRAVELLEQVGHALELKRAKQAYERSLSANPDLDSPGLSE